MQATDLSRKKAGEPRPSSPNEGNGATDGPTKNERTIIKDVKCVYFVIQTET